MRMDIQPMLSALLRAASVFAPTDWSGIGSSDEGATQGNWARRRESHRRGKQALDLVNFLAWRKMPRVAQKRQSRMTVTCIECTSMTWILRCKSSPQFGQSMVRHRRI